MFQPSFQISAKATTALMDIEASRQAVATLPVSAQLLSSLRESARLTSTHYSTQIEGNRLTEDEVAAVAKGGTFPNRSRDETEVKNYFLALDYVESLINKNDSQLTVGMIQSIHGCVMAGKAKPTAYRDGQNVIRESGSGNIIYMPPEWTDIAALMEEMVLWLNRELVAKELPIPIVAAIGQAWTEEGFLLQQGERRGRRYELAGRWLELL
jgi:Fic family protein